MSFTAAQIPLIVKADNDLLTDADGRVYTDLFTANGACWLGHSRAEIAQALQEQAQAVWLLGGLRHVGTGMVAAAIQPFIPPGLRFASLASTGMEIAELAARVARVTTGRAGAIGFAGSMHGKSLAMSTLGWDHRDGVAVLGWMRLPFIHQRIEECILEDIDTALRRSAIGAVFLEVMQGSNGAHEASTMFYRSLEGLVRGAGALLVCDEVLTGFHRSGPRFRFEHHGLQPDIVLFGKACGNGFPVSGLLLREGLSLDPRMLPGSTFAGNPLACAVVARTLDVLSGLDAGPRSIALGDIVQSRFKKLPSGWQLRGSGALWILECPDASDCARLMQACFARGVSVGAYGRWLRIMPALTICQDRLAAACSHIFEALTEIADQ